MSRPTTSTLALALANSGAAASSPSAPTPNNSNERTQSLDIPKPRNANGSKPEPNGLPTPPNSISPKLYPFGATAAAPEERDALRSAPVDVKTSSPSANDGSHMKPEITPELLAARYLPLILQQHQQQRQGGPLDVQRVLAHLTMRVPGFASLPPAKARRVVLAALGESNGSVNGNKASQGQRQQLMFEKVGWRRANQENAGRPQQVPKSLHGDSRSPLAAAAGKKGEPMPAKSHNLASTTRSRRTTGRGRHVRSSSMTTMAESPAFSHSGSSELNFDQRRSRNRRHVDYPDHHDDADEMSLDDRDDPMIEDDDDARHPSSSRANGDIDIDESDDDDDDDDDDLNMDWDEADDMTDEEDWAEIGADALLARSYGASPPAAMAIPPSMSNARTAGRAGIVPLQAQQAIAQYQCLSRSQGQGHGQGRPMSMSRFGRAAGAGPGSPSPASSLQNPAMLAKSLPAPRGMGMATSAGVGACSPSFQLRPEQREQLAGSMPEERAAIEALLRLGSTPS